MGGIEQAVSGEVDDPVLAGVRAGENGAGGVEIERLNPVGLGNQSGDSEASRRVPSKRGS